MRLKFAICLPSITKPAALGGGFLNTIRFAELLRQHADVELVGYRRKEDGVWFLPDVESQLITERFVLVTVWGPDVRYLVERYHSRLPVLYYQNGIDYGVRLYPDVPVLCASRYLLGHAQEQWPGNPQFYLPPVLGPDCANLHQSRDIDVTIVRRKMPSYVVETLVQMLEPHCRVHLLEDFVERSALYRLFNRTRVYVYAFAPQRADHSSTGWRMMEGFGIQPLEASVCGCTIFTNLRGGLADYVDPWVHGYRLESHSPAWDVHQILQAVKNYSDGPESTHQRHLIEHYSEEAFHTRAKALIAFLEDYLPFAATHPPDTQAFGFPEPITRWERMRDRTASTLSRWKRSLVGPRPQRDGDEVDRRRPASV